MVAVAVGAGSSTMGTKANPGQYDCHAKALPNEPMFVLLARDPDFQHIVTHWALRREQAINRGERPATDKEMVIEAIQCARDGAKWREDNFNKWKDATTEKK